MHLHGDLIAAPIARYLWATNTLRPLIQDVLPQLHVGDSHSAFGKLLSPGAPGEVGSRIHRVTATSFGMGRNEGPCTPRPWKGSKLYSNLHYRWQKFSIPRERGLLARPCHWLSSLRASSQKGKDLEFVYYMPQVVILAVELSG